MTVDAVHVEVRDGAAHGAAHGRPSLDAHVEVRDGAAHGAAGERQLLTGGHLKLVILDLRVVARGIPP